MEWNIPAAEHGTVMFAPTTQETALLHEFERRFDGMVNATTASTPANEAQAVAAIRWLGAQVSARRTPIALFLANHPARRGLDSPHEIRAWRDADPTVAVGMEGAPGHQAAGIAAAAGGVGSGRGGYDNAPIADSFAGYPPESYRTFGGFDWMTATVGGLWDSLLAEGKGWWITANSDAHRRRGQPHCVSTPVAQVQATGRWSAGLAIYRSSVYTVDVLREPTFLILAAVAPLPLHGYGILQSVEELSEGRVRLRAGTLYAALDRLVREGSLVVDREEVVEGRLRRYYRITDNGLEVLRCGVERLEANVTAARGQLALRPDRGFA